MSELSPELILAQKEAKYYRKLFEQRASQLVNAEFEVSKLRRDVKRTNLSLSLIAELNKHINVEDSFESAVKIGLNGIRSSLELDAAFYIELINGKVQKILNSGYKDEEVKKLENTKFPDIKFRIQESGIIVREASHEIEELSTLSKIISLPYFVLVPLFSDNNLVGLLIAGRKIEKEPYAPRLDEEDRIILFTLGSWITSMLKDRLIGLMNEYLKLIDKNIIISSTDLNGVITYVSDAFCKVSGYSKEEIIGHTHSIMKHPDMPKSSFRDLWDTIVQDKVWTGEIKNKDKNGRGYWMEASIFPTFDEKRKKIGYTAIRQNITDKKIIEQISITDGLTGIYNRRYFNELFPKVINGAKREDKLVGFIILDIDYFKPYNDIYGHQMGDDVLIKVAKTISGTINRADDYCFRLGGEEFGVIFHVDTQEKAIEFANKFRKNIENLQISHNGNSASDYVTASVGLIFKKANKINNIHELYKQADDLLYKAKNSGRNRVCSNI